MGVSNGSVAADWTVPQSAAPLPANWRTASAVTSKTSSVLGGQTSRLQQIAEQQGAEAGAAEPQALQPRDAAQPAAYTSAAPTYMERAAHVSPGPAAVLQPASVRNLARPSRPTSTSSPDVFGSTALSIGRTPLDAKWASVSHAPVSRGSVSAVLEGGRNETEFDQIQRINAWVNARIQFVDDSRQHGVSDQWASAEESLRRGAGDCEDYAIAKLQVLRAAGFAEEDLYLVIVRDLIKRADHAVLAVRTEGRLVILDSNTDRVLPSEVVQDYRPLMSYSGDRSWIHGYQQNPQVQFASAEASPAAQ